MRRVLIVDDNEAIRDSLCDALADEGYEVSATGDAEHALAAARTSEPSVVLLDLMLPGMDGTQVARRLAREGCRAPVIVLSADRAGAWRAREAGAAAFLAKPFDLGELLATIDRVAPPGAREAAGRPAVGR